ncbi:MAG TPA: PAS domain-containing protein [Caulobacter sp.]|nr:PAS domain-containing protein [Caulobacter sp.]
MAHPNTERLTEYWRAKAGHRAAPTRADIDPMEFVSILPQTLIVGRREAGDLPFRLVGGLIAHLHQRDLRGVNLLSLFAPADRAALRLATEQIHRRPEPLLIEGDIRAEGVAAPVGLEMVLLPLADATGEIDRFLGHYQPIGMTARLVGRTVSELKLGNLSRSGEDGPRLRLAALDGRQIA